MAYTFSSTLWRWQSNGGTAWYFLNLPEEMSDDIAEATSGMKGGFGSVKVNVTIGATTWSTSLFPSKEHATYMLPVKKPVRTKEKFGEGDEVSVSLELA